MKNRIYLIALVLLLALSINSYANVYATDVKVSSTTLAADGTATVTISFILNEDADNGVDIKIYAVSAGAKVIPSAIRTITLASATKGANSVEWDGKDTGGTLVAVGDYSIEVTASDNGYTAWTKISDDTKTAIWSPRGIAVNRNPDSPYFGRIYVTNKDAGTSTNTGAFLTDRGVLMYTQDQEFVGFSNGGVEWPTSTSGSPHKVMVGPDDMVYVGDYANDLLYAFDADIADASQLLVLGASNRETGQYISGHWTDGSGADRAIYTADGHYGAYTGIKKYDIGLNDVMPANDTGYVIIERPNGIYYQYDVELASDGSVYMCQYRSAKGEVVDKEGNPIDVKGAGEAYPIVKYKPWVDDGNKTPYTIDDTLWTVTKQMTDAKGIGLDEPRNRIAYGAYNSGNVYVFNATTGELVDTVKSGRNRNWDVAFDAVGNMYLVDNSSEYWTMISPPDGANSYTTPCSETVAVVEIPTGIFFSEYIEGSSNNKAVEIYNGSGESVDLANFAVWRISNDGDWTEGETNAFALSGTLADGDVYVIGNASAVAAILDVSDVTGTTTYFNGDDPIALVYNGTIIDVVGAPYVVDSADDPIAGWDVAGVTDATAEHTMVRKTSVTTGNTDWAASAGTNADDSEWVIYPQNTFGYLGSHPTLPEFAMLALETSVDKAAWNAVNGDAETGFSLLLDEAVDFHYLNLAPTAMTNIPLAEGTYGFTVATHPADFFTYWAGRGVDVNAATGTWQAEAWKIINGQLPTFFVKVAADGSMSLIDGLVKAIGQPDEYLRVEGTYLQGDYSYVGTVTSDDGQVSENITVSMTFLGLAVPEFTNLTLATSIDKAEWTSIEGNLVDGFSLLLDPAVDFHYLDFDPTTETNVVLKEGLYGFIVETTPEGFLAYWAGRGVDVNATAGTWQAEAWKIINGDLPTFYVKVAADGSISLIDGLVKAIGQPDEFLRVEGTYLAGDYSYTGTVTSVDDVVSEPIGVSITFIGPPPAAPSLPHYEGFDYTVGDALGVQATNWTNLNSGDSVLVTSGSLSYNGLLSSTGNKVSFNGGGFDPYLTFEEVTSGPVYASFIFKVTDQSAMTDLTDGGYFAAIADTTFSYDARIWVRPNPNAAGTTFDIGFGYVSSVPPTTTETYNVGDEIFVVMSYNLDDGVVSAWINPSSDDFEATTVPTATLTSTEATPATKLSKFFLRQDSDGETPFMELDELRLGTTWAEVTPAAPVLSNDLNLTFEDDTDVANWGFHDEATKSTLVYHDPTGGTEGSGALKFTDAGWGLIIKKPVAATAGAGYSLSIDVKAYNWPYGATPFELSVQGLSSTEPMVDVSTYADFTTVTLTGLADVGTAGYIRFFANSGSGKDTTWIDNLIWDDDVVIPDTDPPTIVMVEALDDTTVVVEFSEDIDVTTGETLTNYVIDREIGSPTAALVAGNMVTLTVDTLASDTLYTMVVNNVEDLSENVIVTDSEITFMWQEYVPGPDLFFSEYIEGSSNNKALEIYNGKGVAVNLAEYSIRGTHDGDADWAYAVFNFPDIVLEAGDVYIVTNTDAGAEIAALADTALLYNNNKTASYNGDDARALFWGEYMLDIIGYTDGDPGTNWPVAGGVGATSENTLVRKADVTMGNLDWAVSSGTDETTSEWVVLPTDEFRFLGSHPHTDFAGPEIVSVIAIGDSLVQVKYSEQVDSTAAVNVANYSIDSGIGSPVSAGIICMHVVTLKLGAGQLLAPNTDYMITVSNIPDLIGNVIEPNTSVLLKNIVPGDLPIDIVSSDFETTAGGWWAPAGSGSTLRILTTSSFELSSDDAYDGTKSKKLTILEDSAKDGGWFIREYNPDKPDVAVDSKLFMYVKSSDPNIQIRFSFYDDGTGGDGDLLASPWIDVTAHADDWQVVGVDLATTPLVKWAGGGDGALSSTNTVSLGSIQLQCPNDVDAVLYFDKLTERPNIAPVEVTFDVSMAVQSILGNFTIGSDFVDVAGSFNNWGGNAMVLDDSDGDSVYTFTVLDLYPGESLEYKFRINGSWDTSEFPSGGPNRTFVVPDTNCVVYHWYNDEDRSVIVGITDMNALPKVFALHQNYPNPFNPITTIKYDLPKEAHVKIMIFDVMGREVRTLVNNRQQAGYQAIQWNAQDNSGRNVSSGYYMYVMQADKFHKTQKMILLK